MDKPQEIKYKLILKHERNLGKHIKQQLSKRSWTLYDLLNKMPRGIFTLKHLQKITSTAPRPINGFGLALLDTCLNKAFNTSLNYWVHVYQSTK